MSTMKRIDELTAGEVMKTEPITAEPWMTARQFAQMLEEEEISGAPIVDQQGHLVGIASRADLIHQSITLNNDNDLDFIFESLKEEGNEDEVPVISQERELHVEDFMVEDPITVTPDVPIRSVAAKMIESRVHRIVVVEGQIPVGIITSLDLARLVAEGAA
jgi:CBS domain-containing protein